MNSIRIIASFASVYVFVTGLGGCGSDSGGSPSCATICSRVTAAHCANDPDCMSQCSDAKSATPMGCSASYDALAKCLSTATFTCDDNEQSVAKSCTTQEDAWQNCVQAAGAADSGAGGSGAKGTGGNGSGAKGSGGKGSGGSTSGAMCNGKTATTPCDSCLATSCCSEITACHADDGCLVLAQCVDACGDDACIQSCADAATQGAVDLYNASLTCADDSCASACSDASSSGGASGAGGSTGSGGKTAGSGVGAPNDGNTGVASPTTPADCLPVPSDVDGYCGDQKYKIIYDCPNGPPYSDCAFNTMDSSGIYCCGH